VARAIECAVVRALSFLELPHVGGMIAPAVDAVGAVEPVIPPVHGDAVLATSLAQQAAFAGDILHVFLGDID
jgi:hypothetical protein